MLFHTRFHCNPNYLTIPSVHLRIPRAISSLHLPFQNQPALSLRESIHSAPPLTPQETIHKRSCTVSLSRVVARVHIYARERERRQRGCTASGHTQRDTSRPAADTRTASMHRSRALYTARHVSANTRDAAARARAAVYTHRGRYWPPLSGKNCAARGGEEPLLSWIIFLFFFPPAAGSFSL